MDPDSSEVRYLKDEKKTLKDKIRIAFPNLSAGDVKIKLNEYWQRICANPDKHAKKLIYIETYDETLNDLNSRIMRKKGKLMTMWGTIKKNHQNANIVTTDNQNNNGNHLDDNGKTVDDELEQENFGAAAGILGDIWSESECDGYTVDAKYVEPVDIDDKIGQFDEYDEKWADKHVKHGYFHLSIMKCDDPTCCGELRSNVHDVLPNKYYPAPRWYTHDKGILELGAKYTDPGKNHHYAHFNTICGLERSYSHGLNGDCHDDWNPMHTKQTLSKTQCRVCLKYFPSKTMMLNHRRALHFRSRDDNLNDIQQLLDENEYDALLSEAEKEFYSNIIRICDDRNGQYLAEMNDGSKMWVVLDDENEKVSSYLDDKNNLDESIYNMPKIDNLKEWNLCPWVPDEDYLKKNDEDAV